MNTPIFDQLATETLEGGTDIVAVMDRPRFEFKGLDVDTRWRVICNRFDREQKKVVPAQKKAPAAPAKKSTARRG